MSMSAGAPSHHGDMRITRSVPPCSAITEGVVRSPIPRRRHFGVWPQIGFKSGRLDAFTLVLSPKPLSQISDEIRPSGHILCAPPSQHKECANIAGDRRFLSCVHAGMWQTWWRHCVHKVAFTVARMWRTWCWHCGEKVAAKWQEWWQLRPDLASQRSH